MSKVVQNEKFVAHAVVSCGKEIGVYASESWVKESEEN